MASRSMQRLIFTGVVFGAQGVGVRRQDIWRRWRFDLAECRPLVGGDVKRRVCGVASAGVVSSVA